MIEDPGTPEHDLTVRLWGEDIPADASQLAARVCGWLREDGWAIVKLNESRPIQ